MRSFSNSIFRAVAFLVPTVAVALGADGRTPASPSTVANAPTPEVLECVRYIDQNGLDYGGGNRWASENVAWLCEDTKVSATPPEPVQCFKRHRQTGKSWLLAIAACRQERGLAVDSPDKAEARFKVAWEARNKRIATRQQRSASQNYRDQNTSQVATQNSGGQQAAAAWQYYGPQGQTGSGSEPPQAILIHGIPETDASDAVIRCFAGADMVELAFQGSTSRIKAQQVVPVMLATERWQTVMTAKPTAADLVAGASAPAVALPTTAKLWQQILRANVLRATIGQNREQLDISLDGLSFYLPTFLQICSGAMQLGAPPQLIAPTDDTKQRPQQNSQTQAGLARSPSSGTAPQPVTPPPTPLPPSADGASPAASGNAPQPPPSTDAALSSVSSDAPPPPPPSADTALSSVPGNAPPPPSSTDVASSSVPGSAPPPPGNVATTSQEPNVGTTNAGATDTGQSSVPRSGQYTGRTGACQHDAAKSRDQVWSATVDQDSATAAVSDCPNCEMGMALMCDAKKHSMEFMVPWAAVEKGKANAPTRFDVCIDGKSVEYNGTVELQGAIGFLPKMQIWPGHEILEKLSSGSHVSVRFNDMWTEFSLRESRQAISILAAICTRQ